MKKYANVVFIQSADDIKEPEKIYRDNGTDALFNYLRQWDYGEDSDVLDIEPWGSDDTLFDYTIGTTKYIMTVNTKLEYFGLCKVID